MPSPDAWSPAEVAALADGLLALPEPLRNFPGGPLLLERVRTPSAFGLGDGSAERPDWKEKRRRFLIYDHHEPEAEERARFRTLALGPALRDALWRRRALVHAVMQRWDDEHRFSARGDWRVISGWVSGLLGGTRPPLNLYEWAYSRERGRQSPSLDLVTFAEELFVSPNDLQPGAVPVDDSVRCQEMTRSRFLASALAEIGARLPPRGPCPLFDAWSTPEDVDRFDVLLAEPSAVHPESVFGHILLQPIRKEPRPPSAQEVFEIAAVVEGTDGLAEFILKGTMGGYLSTFGRSTMAQLRHRYQELDQRSLRRFGLHLTADEREQVLERMWELERRGYLPYYFVSDNCASLLLFLLAPAIGAEAAAFRYPWAMPTVVLDELARTRRQVPLEGGGTVEIPLLTLEPAHEPADIEVALRADQQRPATLEALIPLLDAASAGSFAEWLEQAQSSEPERRREGYAELARLVSTALARSPQATRDSQRALWAQVLDEQVAIERYAADRARRAVAAVDDARIIRERVKPPTAADLLRFRQKLFRREDAARPRQELHQLIELEWLWSTAPRRPATPAEEAVLARSRAAHEAFRQLATASALLRADGTLEPPAPPAPLDRGAWLREQARPAARGSGHGRLGAQPLGLWSSRGGAGGGVRLRLAFLGEHLGDQRDRGFGPRTEVRALDFSAVVGFREGGPQLVWADAVLFRFRTTTRQPELMQTGLFTMTGRGGGIEYRRRANALWRDVVELHGALYLPLAGQDGADGRLWALGFGSTGQLRFAQGKRSVGVGPRVEWLHRVPLGPRAGSALRLETTYSALLSRAYPLEHQAAGTLLLELPLRVLGRDLLLAPTVTAEVDWRPGATQLRGTAGLALEPL
jgi:hypothetical protein